MALEYSYVLPPTGQADNHVIREMFDDVKEYVEDLALDSAVVHLTGDETIAGVKTFEDGIITPSINGSGVWGFRNRIINGDMRIDQRNVGAAVTVNATTTFFPVDRFDGRGESADGVFTLQQLSATPPTGFTAYVRATVTTADASIGATQQYWFRQNFEGTYVKDFLLGSASAVQFTLSFWVRSSVTGTFGGSFQNSAVDRSYPFTYAISSANTWEQKTVTVTGDTTGTWLTTTGVGLRVHWGLGVGSTNSGTAGAWAAANYKSATSAVALISTLNATWDITGVQLEVGNQATEFEYRPDAVELWLCQRYFAKTLGQTVQVKDNPSSLLGTLSYRTFVTGTTGIGSVMWRFPVTMRTSPTITIYNPNASGTNSWNDSDGATAGTTATNNIHDASTIIRINQVAADTLGDLISTHATASAEL